MGERLSETLTVVVRRDPDPECTTCGGAGEYDDEYYERYDCHCCEDSYRTPTDADLVAHLLALRLVAALRWERQLAGALAEAAEEPADWTDDSGRLGPLKAALAEYRTYWGRTLKTPQNAFPAHSRAVDSDALTVARELVARPEWEWREGMRVVDKDGVYPVRVVLARPYAAAHEEPVTEDAMIGGCPVVADGDLPDLDDRATAGVLLGMLTEAQESPVHLTLPWGRGPNASDVDFGGDAPVCAPTLGVAAGRALLLVWRARG